MGQLETLALQRVSTETIAIIKDYYLQTSYIVLFGVLGLVLFVGVLGIILIKWGVK